MISKTVFMGGATAMALTSDFEVEGLFARVMAFDPDMSGHAVYLPDARNLRLGGPQLYIINLAAPYTINIKDSDGTLLFTLLNEKAAVFLLRSNLDESGSWQWIVFDRTLQV